MLKQFNLLKQFGSVGKSQDATDLLSEELVLVEQRVEPARKAAQTIHKRLAGCLQSQHGLDAEKRVKKLPLMMLSLIMAESFKDFDGGSPIRKVLEMCCFMQSFLAKTLADFEVQLEKEVLEPLNKLSEEDLPEILKNKKLFAKLTTDWHNARNRSQNSTGPQAKQDGLREEMEETWRRLENIKDQYSADLYHFATKEDVYAGYFIHISELQAEYHKTSLGFLEKYILEMKDSLNETGSKKNSTSGKVFGEPLLTHLLDSGKAIAVPIQECVCMLLRTGMREEGLFRLTAAASVVKKLKNSLDCGNVDHSEFSKDPHAVAGALKSYLRELPEPLMTFELYDEWFKAAGEKEVPDKLERLKKVLRKLPPENYDNLRYLVQFLARLSEQQSVNRMSPSNIAIVLGPNLLWPKIEGMDSLLNMASASSVQVVTVIEPLIQNARSLFPEEEDFEIPQPPAISASPSLKSRTENLSPTALCSTLWYSTEERPPFPPPSPMVAPEDVHVLPLRSPSPTSCTFSWENLCFDLPSLQPIQNQSPGPNQTKTPDTSLPEPTLVHPPSNPGKKVVPLRAKRSFLQYSPSVPLTNEPKPEVSAPATQRAASWKQSQIQEQPTHRSQASVNRKPGNRRGAIGPPKFPPPSPPQKITKQLSSTNK